MTDNERAELAAIVERAIVLFEKAYSSYQNTHAEREQLQIRMARVLTGKFGSLPQRLESQIEKLNF